MKYPALVTNKQNLRNNILEMQKLCAENGVSFCAVTKCFCAIPEITEVYYKAGVRDFADSRILNLRRMDYAGIRKWLLRIPMLSEAEDVVKYADVSLNSEVKTIAALSEAALELGKRHGVVLMVDVGDLREGVLVKDAVTTAGEILKHTGVELLGIGTNLNCYGGIIPTVDNLTQLAETAEAIEKTYGITLSIVSGGNSGSIHMLTSKTMPKKVNNLRLGEVLFIGVETSYQQRVGSMNSEVFRLEAQIVECKEKPSLPIGESGLNAFGDAVSFVDKGPMKRAIIACGHQDVSFEKIVPFDPKIEIIGSSSDHMIIDVTHADKKYQVGDVLSFSISYGSLLTLSTSEYVHKCYE